MTSWTGKKVGLHQGAALAALCIFVQPVPACAQAQSFSFDIPAQDLGSALRAFARISRNQVTFDQRSVRGKRSPALRGSYAANTALEMLLEGSGLVARRGASGVFIVKPAAMSGSQSSQVAQSGGAAAGDEAASSEGEGEEILVVGTHIRNAPPAGQKPIIVTAEQIRAGGFTRVEEVLRSLPQNVGSGPREDTYAQQAATIDRVTTTNFSKGASVNLRGLGAGTTLVLVDGRRLSPSGTTGLFTDVSNLPLAAIERIEVLTDGASALYGSDAVGGVVNVVLKKNYRGFETSIRGATGSYGNDDLQVSQVVGIPWKTGRLTLSYEYLRRGALHARDTPFAADSDQRPRGGDNFSALGSNPGTLVVGTRMYAIPAGQDGRNLNPASLVEGTANYRNEAEFLDLLPRQERHNASFYLTQEVGSNLTLWARSIGNIRDSSAKIPYAASVTVPRTNPFYINPTGGTGNVVVRYDFTPDTGGFALDQSAKSYTIDVGADLKVGRDWKISFDATQGEEEADSFSEVISSTALAAAIADSNPATALNVFGDGSNTPPATIAKLITGTTADIASRIRAGNVVAEGPLFTWSGGTVRLAVGGELRNYRFISNTASEASNRLSSGERTVRALFGELRIPIVGKNNRSTLLHELTLSAAVRYEEYSDFGGSTVPKFGVSWAPFEPLRLRASYSQSFRAPDLASLNDTQNRFSLSTVTTGTGSSATALIFSGGNPDLKAETATNYTIGADLDVPGISGLRLGTTYYNIRYKNRIGSPFAGLLSTAEYLGNPLYAPFVFTSYDPAFKAQICGLLNTSTSAATCIATPVVAIIDSRSSNVALVQTSGIDFDLNFTRETPIGTIGAALNGTHIFRYAQATIEGGPEASLLNQKYRPINTRFRGSLSWSKGPWSAIAFVNYVDGYTDISTPTRPRPVGAWTTVDLNLGWESPSSRGPLSGLSIALNAQNLFEREPPFVNTQLGYDVVNANPYGRVVSLSLRKRW